MNHINAKNVQTHLRSLSNSDIAERSQKFFKTSRGDYGHGDKFLGIRVPTLRAEIKRYVDMPMEEVGQLLQSPFHEERLFSLLLLVHQFIKSDVKNRKTIFEFYLEHTDCINNWDLVDCSAYQIVGEHLIDKSRKPLYGLAESKSLWERRIAIISTLRFIKESDFADTLKISEILLRDEEDLIQKAVGWMLREIGNRDRSAEENFLKQHYRNMPRTMLRYAIEKFPEEKRQSYLRGRV